MLTSLIKLFFMILCSYYIFTKLLHLFPSRKQYALALLATVVLSVIMCFVNRHVNYLNALLMAILFCGFVFLQYRTSIKITLVTSIISCAMSYIIFSIASLLTALLIFWLSKLPYLNNKFSEEIMFTIVGVCQLLLSIIPFRFKRLKKGMPYLQDGKFGDFGFILCIILLIITSLIQAGLGSDSSLIAYMISIAICGIFLITWWLKRLTLRYLSRLKAQEVSDLKLQIQQLSDRNAELQKNNEVLSKIIHKDNKLIPAMEHSVQTLVQSLRFSDEESLAKANELLQYLASVSKDRSGILLNYEHQHRSLLQTGVTSIDSMIGYMEQKAYSDGVSLNLTITGSIKYLTETVIKETDLSTLIADLLENALNAVGGADLKHILLCIGIEGDHYSLDVFDSGAPISEEVLPHLGKQRFTSHAETGGSGIGMMTTFEILRKYSASFVLDEINVSKPYSKKLSICFDGLNQFRVKSNRPELLELQSTRPDAILI